MIKFKGATFANTEVVLDGNEYDNCTFNSCTFVYSGGAFVLANNAIAADCHFVFRGAAANTVTTMQAVFRMGDWGRETVLKTFQQIAPGLNKLN